VEKIKLAYIVKRFPRFSETFILNELLTIQSLGIEVDVFSLLRPSEEQQHDIFKQFSGKVYWLPKSIAKKFLPRVSASDGEEVASLDELLHSQNGLLSELLPGKSTEEAAHLVYQASQVAMIATANGVTHLHAHFASNTTAVATLASRLSGIPFSFTAHARDIYHRYVDTETDEQLLCRKMASARFCVTVSDYNKAHLQSLQRKYGFRDSSQVIRLYNGVDLSRFRADDLAAPGNTLLAVGRLVEKKGFHVLIQACALLHQRGVPAKCEIVGDGPEYDALKQLICQLGLTAHVRLSGARPQQVLRHKLQQASMVILPCIITQSGDRDALPTVLLEAMAMSRACVSTRVSGIPEIIDHGKTGLLVATGRPDRQRCRSQARALSSWHFQTQSQQTASQRASSQ